MNRKVVGEFRVDKGEGGHLVVREGDQILSEGHELHDDRAAEWFIREVARERGWSVGRSMEGVGVRYEATIDPSKVLFSQRSVREVDAIKSLLDEEVSRRAAEIAAAEGRTLVDQDDILAAMPEAIQALMRQLQPTRRADG